jgi:hypothetical protein
MTDHKASIKIEFTIYGETAKMDSWINWSPHDSQCFPIDQRVIDFFDTAYDKARRGYDERLQEAERESRDRERCNQFVALSPNPPPFILKDGTLTG